MTSPEALEQQRPVETLEGLGQSVVVDDIPMALYKLPGKTEGSGLNNLDMVGTDNAAILERMINEGVSGLADGETVRLVFDDSETLNHDAGEGSYDVFAISRVGDYFITTQSQSYGVHEHVPTDPGQLPNMNIEDGTKRLAGFFDQGNLTLGRSKADMGLFQFGGNVAAMAQEMGIVTDENGGAFPMPELLKANIARIREAGVHIPNIKFFKDGHIAVKPYIMAWAGKEEGIEGYHEGEFPASEQPGYLYHDLLQEHKRPLDILMDDAMVPATLYARAALESDEIVARQPINKFQGNVLRPELKDVVLSGEAKDNHVAEVLDQFSGDFDRLVDGLRLEENDPDLDDLVTEFPPNRWRRLPDMVQTILHSNQRDEFVGYLTSIGSQALNPETNEFSYETYAREIFGRAQTYWEIDTQPRPSEESDFSFPEKFKI